MDFIYKDEQQVAEILREIGWKRIIEAVEETFVEEAKGRVDCPPKQIMFLPNGNDLRLMPARMDKYPYVGVKLISAHEANEGRPTIGESGTYSLYDVETSKLLMFCMANELTAFRTAAATAVAVKHLATKKDYYRVGIIGCGKQSSYHIEAIQEALGGQCEFWVIDKDVGKSFELAHKKQHIIPISKEVILKYVNIIITLTPTTEPHIFAKDIDFDRDVLYCAVGGDNKYKIEIHQEVLTHMHVFCDSYEQVKHTGIMHRFNGILPRTSLGDFITRESTEIRTRNMTWDIPGQSKLFISTGVALQDLAMARMIYERDK